MNKVISWNIDEPLSVEWIASWVTRADPLVLKSKFEEVWIVGGVGWNYGRVLEKLKENNRLIIFKISSKIIWNCVIFWYYNNIFNILRIFMKKELELIEKELTKFIHNFDTHFNNMDSVKSNTNFKEEINKLWQYILSVSDIDDRTLFNEFSTKSELYQKIKMELMSNQDYYEKIVESEDAKKILTSLDEKLAEDSLKEYLSDYNVGGLELAQYDIELIDNLSHPFETFLMVGCGSLSYTMIDFALKHPKKRCIGIDVEKTPIHEANEIKKKFKMSNIQYERIDE